MIANDRHLTVHKADYRGQILTSYPAWFLSDGPAVLVLARWQRPTLDMPYVSFAHGDLLFETFYLNRPYNIFALRDGSHLSGDFDPGAFIHDLGQQAASVFDVLRMLSSPVPLKGYYVNFTAPIRFDAARQALVWRDVCLDLWAPTRGQPLLLDEEEYTALDLPSVDPGLHNAIQSALADLWPRAIAHTAPFDDPAAALDLAETNDAGDHV